MAEDAYAAIAAPAPGRGPPAAAAAVRRRRRRRPRACAAASRSPRSSTTATPTPAPPSTRSPTAACSPSTATPSRWPTRRCSASGPACGPGWRRTCRAAGCTAAWATPPARGTTAGATRPSSTAAPASTRALDWAAGHGDELNHIERTFLDASRAARDAERRREAVPGARLRALLAAVAVALVVSLAAGALAVGQRDRASDQGPPGRGPRAGRGRERQPRRRPERSVLLALEAVERSRTGRRARGAAPCPKPRRRCTAPSTGHAPVLRVPGLGGALDWSPKGDTFVTEGPEQSGRDRHPRRRRRGSRCALPRPRPDVNEAAYSRDGALLLTTGDDGAARYGTRRRANRSTAIEGRGMVWGP